MKLFYRDIGNGVPLIILHGLYGSSDNWISIAKKLADRFRIIIPDQRNHGQSPHNKEHTYISMARDLLELVDLLKIERFYLAGHSMGGKTAMWFVSKWPERILGLTVIDISPFKPENEDNPAISFHRTILSELASLPLREISSREQADSLLSKKISSPRIRAFLLKNLLRNKNHGFSLKLNPGILTENLDNILEGFERNSVAEQAITGFPVLFIKAGDSDYIPDADTGLIEQLYPASEILTIENSSHWVHAEKPNDITRLILSQLE